MSSREGTTDAIRGRGLSECLHIYGNRKDADPRGPGAVAHPDQVSISFHLAFRKQAPHGTEEILSVPARVESDEIVVQK